MISVDKQISRYFKGFFNGVKAALPEKATVVAYKLVTEFNLYMDAMARSNHARFHHVYEWNMVGEEAGRLFSLQVSPMPNGAVISYSLLPSVMPNENGVVFVNKAIVMESGEQVSFTTDKPVPIGDDQFRVGEFTFIPGGMDTNGAFRETFITYFMTVPQIQMQQKNITINQSGNSEMAGYHDARRLLQ